MYNNISMFKNRCSIVSIIVFVFFLSGALQVHAQTFSWYDPLLETASVINGRAWEGEIGNSYA